MSNGFYSNVNNNLGAVQTDVYSGYVVSLPVVERSLMIFANTMEMSKNEAELQLVRKFDPLKLDNFSRTPISRTEAGDDRVQDISGATVAFKAFSYGVSLMLDNTTKVNTRENMNANSTKLFANWGSKLQDSLLFNMLRSAGQKYVFALADTTAGGKASRPNVKDCARAKRILDKNKVRRTFMRMMRATDQVGTRPVGQSFVGHISVSGRSAFELSFNPSEIVRPFENPSVSDYLYQNLFYIPQADLSIYHSTEIFDSASHRIMIMHGDEAYGMCQATPMGNRVIQDPVFRSPFGMHTKISYRISHAQAVFRNERIVNCAFTDA